MEDKIFSGLRAIGYNGDLLNKKEFKTAIEYGAKNVEYTKLVHFLTNEIRMLSNIDEEVNLINSLEDSPAFIMEITSFLKELGCPYMGLMQGHVSDRLQNVADRLLLLDYLITELMTSRAAYEKKPEKKIELKLQESDEAADLKSLLMTLRFPKPPAHLTVAMLFDKMVPCIMDVVRVAGKDLVGKAMFDLMLTDKQWDTLESLQKDLDNEYKIRKEMLLTRLDVTIQSFQWSDRTKGRDEQFEAIYKNKRKLLKCEPNVNMALLMSARTDLAIIEKTSSSNVQKNTKSSVHKVIIGQVPDRGGRTDEIAPPPPEMPSWQQRQGPPGVGGGGRGGGGYNRGRGSHQQNFSARDGGQHYSRGGNSFGRGGSASSSNRGFGSNNLRSSDRLGDSSYSRGSSTTVTAHRPFDSAGSYDMRSSISSTNDQYGSSNNYYSDNNKISSYTNVKSGSGGGNYKRPFDLTDHSSWTGGGGGGATARADGNNYQRDEYRTNETSTSRLGYDNNFQSQNASSKRARNYDSSYHTNRTSHANEYVDEYRSNRQYTNENSSDTRRNRGEQRGSGRSNYHRGGRY